MKSRITKFMPWLILTTVLVAVGMAFAENNTQEVKMVSENKSDLAGIPVRSDSEIIEKVEDRLKVDVYAIVPFEDQTLYTVFTTKGAYTVDEDVSIAFKGKVIEIGTGKNIQGEHLDQVKDVIKSKIEQRNAIDAFTSRQSTAPLQSKANGAESVPLSKLNPIVPPASDLSPQAQANNNIEGHAPTLNKVVELSPDAFQALKRQTNPMDRMKELARERTMQYPGAQHYAQRKIQNDLKNSTAPVSEITAPNTREKHTDSESILDTLKNLPNEVRVKHGPKFAPQILTNIADSQFVVFEPNESVEFRGTLTIATDITCPYCKQLHSIVPNLTEQGVRVRYMPYPRSRIINYSFPNNFTIDEYLARTRTEPLNQIGQLISAGYCSEDNAAAFSELFDTKSLSKWPSEITDKCKGMIREFKIVGDLLFGGNVPYMVWSDDTGNQSETGTIKGILRTDRTIDDLLKRLEVS